MSSLKAIRMKEFFDALRVRQMNQDGKPEHRRRVRHVGDLSRSDEIGSAVSEEVPVGSESGGYDGGIHYFTSHSLATFVLFAIAAMFLFVVVGSCVDSALGEPSESSESSEPSEPSEQGMRVLKLTVQIVFNVAFLLALYYLPPLLLRDFRLLAPPQKNVLYLCLFGAWAVALAAQTKLRGTFARATSTTRAALPHHVDERFTSTEAKMPQKKRRARGGNHDKKRTSGRETPLPELPHADAPPPSPQVSREILELQQSLTTRDEPNAAMRASPPPPEGMDTFFQTLGGSAPSSNPQQMMSPMLHDAERTVPYTFLDRQGDENSMRETSLASLQHNSVSSY